MEARDVAARMTTFMVLLYAVYMGALVVGGLGLYSGVIPGGGSFAMTVVPALFGGAVIALVASAQLVKPGESRLRRWLSPVGDGVRDARRLIRPATPACSARSCGGRSTSPRCGRASRPSATRPPSASSWSATSSACSPTRSRSPAASAASTAA